MNCLLRSAILFSGSEIYYIKYCKLTYLRKLDLKSNDPRKLDRKLNDLRKLDHK